VILLLDCFMVMMIAVVVAVALAVTVAVNDRLKNGNIYRIVCLTSNMVMNLLCPSF